MQIHSLGLEDFYEDNYTLIGIHTTLEDFKLAYLLNSNLNTHFLRANFSLDFETNYSKASFSIYHYTNEKYDYQWHLIANSFREDKVNPTDTIALSTETKTYLIPEKRDIDYFMKIAGETNKELINKTIDGINSMNQIAASYTINRSSLKSKESLIF